MVNVVWGGMGTFLWEIMGSDDWGAIAWQWILQQELHRNYVYAASEPSFHRIF